MKQLADNMTKKRQLAVSFVLRGEPRAVLRLFQCVSRSSDASLQSAMLLLQLAIVVLQRALGCFLKLDKLLLRHSVVLNLAFLRELAGLYDDCTRSGEEHGSAMPVCGGQEGVWFLGEELEGLGRCCCCCSCLLETETKRPFKSKASLYALLTLRKLLLQDFNQTITPCLVRTIHATAVTEASFAPLKMP